MAIQCLKYSKEENRFINILEKQCDNTIKMHLSDLLNIVLFFFLMRECFSFVIDAGFNEFTY